ncbi:hypothetical protein EVAR_68260_1 [Eumeta japonica]|uniref:Uncharacterized protein n=1 Tax=Eumeta variegata TaxID=151549 RepID=A0A4C1ZT15_EUMVA|nr:hypothetical protein EVAR_68260_1 [Eumeta japonica]
MNESRSILLPTDAIESCRKRPRKWVSAERNVGITEHRLWCFRNCCNDAVYEHKRASIIISKKINQRAAVPAAPQWLHVVEPRRPTPKAHWNQTRRNLHGRLRVKAAAARGVVQEFARASPKMVLNEKLTSKTV